jgi:hypothetical protein
MKIFYCWLSNEKTSTQWWIEAIDMNDKLFSLLSSHTPEYNWIRNDWYTARKTYIFEYENTRTKFSYIYPFVISINDP